MNQDFVDLLRAFNARDVRYLVVGAYALALHGRPRATGDLDVWVDATPANAPLVLAALADFGAPTASVTEHDFACPGIVFQMGLPPRRIDIITQLTGLSFADAWPHRVSASFGSVEAHYIGRRDFIANKKATGRSKDIADAESLE